MLLVFRSTLPPSHYQNKAPHLSVWLLFVQLQPCKSIQELMHTYSSMHGSTQAATHILYGEIHTHTNAHRAHSVLHPLSQPSSCRHKTLSFPPTLSLFLWLSHTPSHRLSFCLPLSSSSPSFLPLSCLSAEQHREAAINAHALCPFFLLLRRVEGERRTARCR